MVECGSCSTPLPEGARFCPHCGAHTATDLAEERRVVTVLFADIVGFTSLSEHRDPEQVKRLIDGCFQKLVADVVAFGGRVDKILGDGILALFGAPIAHEDDAERAVRAALRMHQTLEAHNREIDARLQMRVGINTGEVLVGALRAGGSYTAMGDVVNTASRLQAEAPPGRVLVGDATKVLSDGPIRYSLHATLTPRGREQSIDAWLAEEALTRPGRHHRRRTTPLIGREDEFSLLLSAVQYSAARHKALLVAIDGEGGVGKSRLAEEVVREARERYGLGVMVGSCVAYGEANVWWPLASAITASLGLDDVSAESLRRVAGARAADLLGLPVEHPDIARICEVFLYLHGEPSTLDRLDAVRAHEELTHGVGSILQARCKRGPMMLAIADVHWSDNVVLALFEQLLNNLAGLPFVVLTTSRPDSDLAWPPTSSVYTALHLRLEPLDRSATEELAAAILGDSGDAATIASLYDRSGGNPLFLEELTTLVAEHGRDADLPDSLRALVSARLDRLTSEQRAMLDNAAVLGTSGSLPALWRFAEALGQHADQPTFDGLVDAGLLAKDGRRWRFRSQSVRDVSYHTLTKAVRAARHFGIAEAMSGIYERVVGSAGSAALAETSTDGVVSRDEIAHHYATAAELVVELGPVTGVPGDVLARAVHWLMLAAERASEQHFMRSAARIATRALELIGEDVDGRNLRERLRLLLIRAVANTELRFLARARTDLDLVLTLAVARRQVESEAEARRWLGIVARLSGNLPAARGELSEAVRLLRGLDSPLRLARALRDRAFVELVGGDPGAAEQLLDEAELLTEQADDPIGLAWVEWHRAWLSFITGDIAQAEARLVRAAETMTFLGDRGGMGWVNGLLAYVRWYQGRAEEAATLADSVLTEARDRGDEWAAGMMQALQANLRLWQGRTDEAWKLADTARQRFRRTSDGFGELQALAPLARANAALGNATASSRAIEEMHALAETHRMSGFVALIDATTAAQLGESERAIRCATTAAAEVQGSRGFIAEALISKALGLVQVGRAVEAEDCLEQARPVTTGSGEAHRSAVQALVDVALGRPEAAVTGAAAVTGNPAATYLDHVYAGLAAAFGHTAMGATAGAVGALDRATAITMRTGDVLARALIALAHRAIGLAPSGDDDGTGDVEIEASLQGWRRLFASFVGK